MGSSIYLTSQVIMVKFKDNKGMVLMYTVVIFMHMKYRDNKNMISCIKTIKTRVMYREDYVVILKSLDNG